jgi:hypothetical protein
MSWLYSLLLLLAAAVLLALALALYLFDRKRRHIIQAAASASDEQLDRIYNLLEQCGPAPPTRCALARTNRQAPGSDCAVTLPAWLAEFPWAGRTISVQAGDPVVFRFTEEGVPEPRFLGKVYKIVGIPRMRVKARKTRSSLSPTRCLARSDALRRALAEVCPRYPAELLSYLVCTGATTFEFEPSNQSLVGTTPAWVQAPEYPRCDQCQGRMTLILQLPGAMLASRSAEATFYWFGCKQHPDSTKTVTQFM